MLCIYSLVFACIIAGASSRIQLARSEVQLAPLFSTCPLDLETVYNSTSFRIEAVSSFKPKTLTVELRPPAFYHRWIERCNLWYEITTSPPTHTVTANLTRENSYIDVSELDDGTSYGVITTIRIAAGELQRSNQSLPVRANGSEGFWSIADALWYA
jgi:hypothetical protein